MLHLCVYRNNDCLDCMKYWNGNECKISPGISLISSCRGVGFLSGNGCRGVGFLSGNGCRGVGFLSGNGCRGVGFVFSASRPFFTERIASAVSLNKIHGDKTMHVAGVGAYIHMTYFMQMLVMSNHWFTSPIRCSTWLVCMHCYVMITACIYSAWLMFEQEVLIVSFWDVKC